MSPPNRVLLVDDNDHCRRALRQVLEGLGYAVSEADDGLEGMQLARSWTPDVAVIGLAMRVVDGFGMARRGGHPGRQRSDSSPWPASNQSGRGTRRRLRLLPARARQRQ